MADGGAARSRVLARVLGAGLLVAVLLWQDRSSLERGNRLFRAGDVQAAVQLYRARAEAPNATATASYNLGTALLASDAAEAEQHLRLARQSVDSAARQRAYYNLGYRFLTGVEEWFRPDSAMFLLAAAIGSNRAALRLDPDYEDARWNLALAQRMLDSLTALYGEEFGDVDEPPETEEVDERPEVVMGSRETLAREGDVGQLTVDEALRLLEDLSDDPELLVRGILWAHRPVPQGWLTQPLPGGKW